MREGREREVREGERVLRKWGGETRASGKVGDSGKRVKSVREWKRGSESGVQLRRNRVRESVCVREKERGL